MADLGRQYDIPYTIVRPANVIGAGSVWVKDVLDAFYRGPVPIIGNGTAPAAFVHVENLVDGVLLAAESEKAEGRTYHFIDDYPVTWAEYITTLGSWIGKTAAREGSYRAGVVDRCPRGATLRGGRRQAARQPHRGRNHGAKSHGQQPPGP